MDIGLSVVGLLVDLVADHVAGGLGARAERGVAVLGDVLVGLLARSRGAALHRLGDVVRCVPVGGDVVLVVEGANEVGGGRLLDGIHC